MPSTSRARAARYGLAAAVVLLLAGCGGDATAEADPGTPSAPAGSATIGDAATTGPLGSGDSSGTGETEVAPPDPPPAPPTFPTTARAYAEATVAAWSGSPESGLAEFTTPGVHEQFLEIPGQLKSDWIHHRCDGVAGSSYCTLRNGDGDSVTLRVRHQYLGAAHAVSELKASLTVYPATGEAYASEFVRAWAAGNTPRMRALARPDVVVAVNNNHQDRPTGTWALGTLSKHGGAGLLIVDIDINEGSIQFTVDVGTTLLGNRRAIVGYQP